MSGRPSPSRPFVQGLFWLFRGGRGAVLSQALGSDPLTHAVCGAAELAGTWGPAPHPHCSRAGGSSNSTAPPVLSCCLQNWASLALQCEQGWPHLLPPPPPPFISAFPPFISAFHLPPEHLVLVVVATPQSAPACCHGTHGILGCPSPISGPCSSCHGCSLLADPSCVLGMPWVQAPSPNQGGLAGPGAGRRPCHGHPLCLPWSCSCTMAIGEVRPRELRDPSPPTPKPWL